MFLAKDVNVRNVLKQNFNFISIGDGTSNKLLKKVSKLKLIEIFQKISSKLRQRTKLITLVTLKWILCLRTKPKQPKYLK